MTTLKARIFSKMSQKVNELGHYGLDLAITMEIKITGISTVKPNFITFLTLDGFEVLIKARQSGIQDLRIALYTVS
jgi:hypothetical protein